MQILSVLVPFLKRQNRCRLVGAAQVLAWGHVHG